MTDSSKAVAQDSIDCQPDQQHKPVSWWNSWRIAGAGTLVAVGYIDPGNWGTDLAGGAYAGYLLLSVVLLSGLAAMLFQIMSARLGIATGKDLAENSRAVWPQLAWPAWIVTELAIIATDLAELLGTAIALKLLFSIPIALGLILTVFDVLFILGFDKHGSRYIERMVAFFLFLIACGLIYELILAAPVLHDVLKGYIPDSQIVLDSKLLYIAVGIIGATVMPHNLYLHSSLVLKRQTSSNKLKSASSATIDTIVSLGSMIFLNSALLILAASVFHFSGNTQVVEITEAHRMLAPLLGSQYAATVFAIMLFAAGQSATITGTLAGQVVMAGFIRLRMKAWQRRLITRMFALVPALIIILYAGEHSITHLIVSSQVFLSLQLPFAMLTLLLLTSDKKRMGLLINPAWMRWLGWACAIVIVSANTVLIATILLY